MATLDGKVAIVTGAGSAIGCGITERYVADGAKVIAAGLGDEEKLAGAFKDEVLFVRTEVSDENAVKAMVGRRHQEVRQDRHPCQQHRHLWSAHSDARSARRSRATEPTCGDRPQGSDCHRVCGNACVTRDR